ncbi:MAG: hypothetical protein ACTS4V_00200 [Candidatus Hodgkinia cicadicola]
MRLLRTSDVWKLRPLNYAESRRTTKEISSVRQRTFSRLMLRLRPKSVLHGLRHHLLSRTLVNVRGEASAVGNHAPSASVVISLSSRGSVYVLLRVYVINDYINLKDRSWWTSFIRS